MPMNEATFKNLSQAQSTNGLLLDGTQPIKSEYSRLAIEERRLRLRLERGEAVCLNCDRLLSAHVHDEKCDNYVTSLGFRSDDRPMLKNVSRALELLEELQRIRIK